MEAHIGDTKVPGIIVTTCICMPLVYIVVCLRFVSRRIGKVKLAANDWLILIAVVNAPVIKFAGSIFNAITVFPDGLYYRLLGDSPIWYGKA